MNRNAAQPDAGAPLPRVTLIYVSVVAGVAALLAWHLVTAWPAASAATVVAWVAAGLASQLLAFRTVAGTGQVSLSTCAHLCMAALLPPSAFIPALVLGRLLGQLVQRRPWERALFNAAQLVVAVVGAWAVFHALAGHAPVTTERLVATLPALLAAGVTYYACNMALTCGVLAITERRSAWAAWRGNFGHAAELAGTAGLVALTPVVLLCVTSLGVAGLALFVLPLMFLRDAGYRYTELRRTQQASLEAGQLAAKSELAAEVGHTIGNCVTVVEGQLRLLAMKGPRVGEEELRRRLEQTLEDVARIRAMSRELIDFTRRQHAPRPTQLRALVAETAGTLAHHPRFDGLRVELELDPQLPEVRVDPEQVQQVLIHLMVNAAQALADSRAPRRIVRVGLALDRARRVVELDVTDNGPGVPEALRERVLEPGFTTRGGTGYGLHVVQSVIRNYGGSLRVEAADTGGARFVVSLPCAGVGLAPRRDDEPIVLRSAGARAHVSEALRRAA